MEEAGMFKVVVFLEDVGEYRAFPEAFARLFRGIKDLLAEGTSYQILETTNCITRSVHGRIEAMDWYEARDIAFLTGVMKEGELVNPLPKVSEEKFSSTFAAYLARS